MNPELWQQVEEIIDRAMAIPTGTARSVYLKEACGRNRELLEEVESLLATREGAESFIERPVFSLPTPEELALIGKTVAHYQILMKLGAGGMGEVYLARDTKLGRKIALKVLPRDMAADRERLKRFEREAEALAALNHPNIITIHSIEEADGLRFITMELVEGTTLAELISPGGVKRARFLELAVPLADALSAAHRKGITHRDLKPANIMVSDEGRLKVLDFGLAKRREDSRSGQSTAPTEALTEEGRLLGTPSYMSPEQVQGRAVDHRSDIFSLGIILYEMASGEKPFKGETLADLLASILRDTPKPLTELNAELGSHVWPILRGCLRKDPKHRPSALHVRNDLEGETTASAAGEEAFTGSSDSDPMTGVEPGSPEGPARPPARLRQWPPPELPALPYPVLLPYSHPALLAGREQEIASLRLLLRMPVPILGLCAPSGAGKSSLLLGGLVPALREAGTPVALLRHPEEPALVGRLLGDLLAGGSVPLGGSRGDDDRQGFVDRLLEVERLAGKTPVLVLDQFEDLLRPGAGAARAVLGVLLSATVERRPGTEEPPCRWLLAYRKEFHGEVIAWLRDVLYDARTTGVSGIDSFPRRGTSETLPHDLSQPDRFHSTPLQPLATPAPATPAPGSGPGDAGLREAARVFRSAIEKPLALKTPDGEPRYPYRFAADGAERLVEAFAEARIARPEAPLTPELQVVLAHLLARAGSDGVVEVPDEPDSLIDEALEDHVRRALETAFPGGRGPASRLGRARALLALRELASRTGVREEGLGVEELAKAIGEGGSEILDQLATPLTRLVVLRESPEGWRYVLSHDRMAEVVVRMVEEEGRHGKLLVDAELLRLRRFVALKTALYRSQSASAEDGSAGVATQIPRRHYRSITEHAEALLWDDDRRAWWTACRKRRRADLRRTTALTTAALLFLVLVSWGTWVWIRQHSQHQALLDQVVEGEPDVAFLALDQLATRPDADFAELLALLQQRDVPMDVLGRGLGGLHGPDRSAAVLRAVEIALPWVEIALAGRDGTLESTVLYLSLVVNLVWALDFAPGRDPPFAERARALRDRVLEPYRRLVPPPPIPEPEDPDWIHLPAGSFLMGTGPDEEGNDDERPRHEVTVSAFRMQRHEVTNAEFRRSFPGWSGVWLGEDDLPAGFVTWGLAYLYAAWLGGRLPTEAEWEYAARGLADQQPSRGLASTGAVRP